MRGEKTKEAKIKNIQVNGVEPGQEEMKKQGGDWRNRYKTVKTEGHMTEKLRIGQHGERRGSEY